MNIYNKNTIIKVLLLTIVSIGLASTVSAANTWTCNETHWNSLEGNHYTKFTCNVGDTVEITNEGPYLPSKIPVLTYAECDAGLFKDITPGGRNTFFSDGTLEAVKAGNFKIWEWEIYGPITSRDIQYDVTVLP